MAMVDLRAARIDDVASVAAIWESGWRDGHLGNVPDALVAARTPASFRARATEHVADTTVAEVDGEVAGDEVEQVYVSTAHRGTGIASTLLAEAERLVSAGGHPSAWLAVAPGNTRARRFYERCGWIDEGQFNYSAVYGNGVIDVPCHRYSKKI